MKRIVDDRDGNPVEIEVEDAPSDRLTPEAIQAGFLWLKIFEGWLRTAAEDPPLPGRPPKMRRKVRHE